MKVYYIFKLKEEFINLYKDTPSILYNILRGIYYLDKEEVDYGYNLFKQLTSPIEKSTLDRNLFIKYHREIPYSKRKDIHYINNLYRNEISRMIVSNCYIKLEIEQNFSTFFEILKEINSNLFACSFKTIDFFFLDDYPRICLSN